MKTIHVNNAGRLVPRRFKRTAMFRAFKAAVGTYVVRGQWNPTDMRIRLLFVMPNTNGWEVLIGNDDWTEGLGWAVYCDQSTSSLVFNNAGGNDKVTSQALTPDTLYEAVIERIGNDHSIHVAGVTNTATFAAAHSAPPELYFGCRHTNDGASRTDFFNDKLVLAELTDLNNSSNCGLYSNFTRPDNIVPNELATLGAELWSAQLADLTNSVGNTAALMPDGTIELRGGYAVAFIPVQIEAGKTYKVEVDATVNAGFLSVFAGVDTTAAGRTSGWGEVSLVAGASITASADANFLIFASRGAGGSVDLHSASAREAPGYAQLHNPAEGSDQRYTKKGQAWLGADSLAAPTIINAPWLDNGNGSYEMPATGNNGATIHYGGLLTVGDLYEIGVSLEGSEGSLRLISNPDSSDVTGDGLHKVDHQPSSTGNFNFMALGSFAGRVRPQYIRHKIPIAPGAA